MWIYTGKDHTQTQNTMKLEQNSVEMSLHCTTTRAPNIQQNSINHCTTKTLHFQRQICCLRILCVFAALQLRVMDCQLCSRGIFANLPMKIRTNLQQLCSGQSVHVNIMSPLAQGEHEHNQFKVP